MYIASKTFLRILLYSTFLCITINNCWSATFYKCKSTDGEMTFSDTPCDKTDETLQEKNVNRNKLTTIESNKEFVENQDGKESPIEETSGAVEQIGVNKNYRLKAKIANILSSFSELKIAMKRFFTQEGKWPSNFSDIGLNENEMNSKYISRVKIKENGKLVAYLNKSFGKKKIILLEPKKIKSMGRDTMEWVCFTNFTKEVLSNADEPLCQSRKIYY